MARSKRVLDGETETDELRAAIDHLDEVSARITRLMAARNGAEAPPAPAEIASE